MAAAAAAAAIREDMAADTSLHLNLRRVISHTVVVVVVVVVPLPSTTATTNTLPSNNILRNRGAITSMAHPAALPPPTTEAEAEAAITATHLRSTHLLRD